MLWIITCSNITACNEVAAAWIEEFPNDSKMGEKKSDLKIPNPYNYLIQNSIFIVKTL